MIWSEFCKVLTKEAFSAEKIKRMSAEYSHLPSSQWKSIFSMKDSQGETLLHLLYKNCLNTENCIQIIQASMVMLRHFPDSKTLKNNQNQTAFQYGCKYADLIKGQFKSVGQESLEPEMVIAVLSLKDIGLPEPGIVDFLNLMKRFAEKTINRTQFDDGKKLVFEKYGYSVNKKAI